MKNYDILKTEAVFSSKLSVSANKELQCGKHRMLYLLFLLLFHQILYVVTETLKSSIIMYLFQFLRTSLPGNLLECEACSCIH